MRALPESTDNQAGLNAPETRSFSSCSRKDRHLCSDPRDCYLPVLWGLGTSFFNKDKQSYCPTHVGKKA